MTAPPAGAGGRLGRRPGPKPRLSREQVVAAALDLGVERVTIGAVAAALGVAPAGLYRYIDSRDDLVAAALEAILAGSPLPPTDRGWRHVLETEAWTRWRLLRRYAGLVRRHERRLVTVAARRMEQLVSGLVELGFDLDAALLAVDSVLDLVHDAAEQMARIYRPDEPGTLSDEMRAALDHYSPPLRAGIEAIVADPEAHVARKLAIVLDGIGCRLAPA
ncbi:TetR family transcriptional regulator [Pseudonocardia sp.]|uniref:TetR family transcriptional regulator n=1 Tax=Pseudonocardia sp. TaxID=60912 RepID=UPI003D0D72C4